MVASAGGNGSPVENEITKRKIILGRDSPPALAIAPLEKFTVLEASGDSMVPTIADGDHLLIDTSQNDPRRDGIYVIRLDDELLVKRVTVDPARRTVTISSDNPCYRPIESLPLAEIEVAGRVIWIGRRV